MNEKQRFSPETGKPNPVSVRECHLMDRHELRAFLKPLDRKEKRDFAATAMMAFESLPLSERRLLQKALVQKLEARKGTGLGDKLELALEKSRLAQLMLPEKKPILFRKIRSKENVLYKKVLGKYKSPFFISSATT